MYDHQGEDEGEAIYAREDTKNSPHATPLPRPHLFRAWDLSHLVEDPVQCFETLVGELESRVAQFESARATLSRPWQFQSSTRC